MEKLFFWEKYPSAQNEVDINPYAVRGSQITLGLVLSMIPACVQCIHYGITEMCEEEGLEEEKYARITEELLEEVNFDCPANSLENCSEATPNQPMWNASPLEQAVAWRRMASECNVLDD